MTAVRIAYMDRSGFNLKVFLLVLPHALILSSAIVNIATNRDAGLEEHYGWENRLNYDTDGYGDVDR